MNQQQHFTPDMTVDELQTPCRRAARLRALPFGRLLELRDQRNRTRSGGQRRLRHSAADAAGEPQRTLRPAPLAVGDRVRIPDEIRAKIPQLANVPEIGEITGAESGAYTAEFGDVRLQGLAEDFIAVEASGYAGSLELCYSGCLRSRSLRRSRASSRPPARRASSRDRPVRRRASTGNRASPRSMSLTTQP